MSNLNQQQFFHHAPTKARESVETEGLRPFYPYDGPKGVYLHRTMEGAQQYMRGQSLEADHDLYEVDLPADWRLGDDPMLDTAVYSRRKIPPTQLRRVSS